MRLTKQQISEIKQLVKEGGNTYDIAKTFNCSQTAICYHTNNSTKTNQSYAQRKEYFKKYRLDKYQNNEEFRKNCIASVRKSKAKVKALIMNDMKGGIENGKSKI